MWSNNAARTATGQNDNIPFADADLLFRVRFGPDNNLNRATVAERFRHVEREAGRSPGGSRRIGPLVVPIRSGSGRVKIECGEGPATGEFCGGQDFTVVRRTGRGRGRVFLVSSLCPSFALPVVRKT